MKKQYMVKFTTVNGRNYNYRIITNNTKKIEKYLTEIYLIPINSNIEISLYHDYMKYIDVYDIITL